MASAARAAAPEAEHTPAPGEPAPPYDGAIGAAVVNASAVDYGDLRRFTGRYEVDPKRAENFVLDITLEGGELWLKPSHSRKRRLIRRSEADFSDAYSDYDITAVFDGRERVLGLRLNSWGRGATARKLALPPPSLRGNVTFRLRASATPASSPSPGTSTTGTSRSTSSRKWATSGCAGSTCPPARISISSS